MSGAEMANKAEEVLATVLQKAMEVAEKTGDFVTEQAPDVVQQMLVWKFAQALVVGLVCAIVSFTCAYLVYRVARAERLEEWHDPATVASMLFGIPASFVMVSCLLEALQIWLAPKVYLIEYTANLIK